MLTAGCDVGSRTAKALILENNTVLTSDDPAKLDPVESAERVMLKALEQAGLALDDLHGHRRDRLRAAADPLCPCL
jgi:activator of 2-hydroxyglutaryl-CoA dehydratase